MTRLRALAGKLRENLEACARDHEPRVGAVHDVRTSTRRIEALLETFSRKKSGTPARAGASAQEALDDVLGRWRGLLKKIRRAAAPVRDLDVHRKLLGELMKNWAAAQSEPEKRLCEQAVDLDAWLRSHREKASRPLRRHAEKWAAMLVKLTAETCKVSEEIPPESGVLRQRNTGARTALESFAHLSSAIELLHGENLHDFRKGAKKARYMAESDGANAYAGVVSSTIKQVQDAIGDWHDWEVLAEEAQEALGDVELAEYLARDRDHRYAEALRVTQTMRGRLVGEWRAKLL
ncbi:CHAD domain-containing protein [Silvibacterium sp.]|uniref:CHAD domain-containing protein n=1 Tax=Silvibacterium sp. TaxID=1964179 RepID=UPI0039E5FE41